MGAYAGFWIGSIHVTDSKNDVDPALMSLFRAEDRHVRQFGDPQLPSYLSGQWDSLDQEMTFSYYATSISVVRDRLELEGYTIDNCRRLFEEWRDLEIRQQESWGANDPELKSDEHRQMMEVVRERRKTELQQLRELTADKWIGYLQQIVEKRLSRRDAPIYQGSYIGQMLESGEELYGYGGPNPLVAIRLAMEVFRVDDKVIYDLTDLMQSNFIDEDEDPIERLIDWSADEYHAQGRVIILTEGRSDVVVLRSALHLLFPHLAGYYSFMDFAEYGGGAGQLANLIRAFAGAGIVNRVVAIFDNDAAALAAMRSLCGAPLSKHMVVMRLPDLPILRSYPTLGPNGPSHMNINGMAAGIELYLGVDVLRGEQGELPPVQWTGFERSVKSYQGELLSKKEVQARFEQKLERARQDPDFRDNSDWSGLNAIFSELFKAFNRLDGDMLSAQLRYVYRED